MYQPTLVWRPDNVNRNIIFIIVQLGETTVLTNIGGLATFIDVYFTANAQIDYVLEFKCEGVISATVPVTMTTNGINNKTIKHNQVIYFYSRCRITIT